jgi:tRNA threonylcarbamoyladenosine biosynthesis protein TsaB
MIIALDTSTATCRLWLIEGNSSEYAEWEAGRQLADGLLRFLRESLATQSKNWTDIDGIIAYRGPGSFTGLRIGLTVLNTIADASSVPIVGQSGDNWVADGQDRLALHENDILVMPLYGREPNITKPRK